MTDISIKDIKFDLLKIIEPYDGRMEHKSNRPVQNLMLSYLYDLKNDKAIHDFSLNSSKSEKAHTFEIKIKRQQNDTLKTLKIHVANFQHPWVKK
jgi:hypothetical protein